MCVFVSFIYFFVLCIRNKDWSCNSVFKQSRGLSCVVCKLIYFFGDKVKNPLGVDLPAYTRMTSLFGVDCL